MAFFVSYYILMKNTHLEHPEDTILYNRESFDKMLQFLRDRSSTATVKWDGAPAIVFGTYEGKWFVGTCLLYTSPSPRDATLSRMPSSA